MADEPHFPPPEEGKRREGAHPTHRTVPSPAMPVIVERPAAIEEDASHPTPALATASTTTATMATTATTTTPKPAPKLTREEVSALLAVEGALRPTPLARVWKRGRIIIVPTGLIGFAGHSFIGGWADVLALVIAVAAILWCARPLFRRDAWS